MNLVHREAEKRPREAILYVDDGGILRRYFRRGFGDESLVVVGLLPYMIQHSTEMLEVSIWEVTPSELAWRIAPSER